MDKKQRLLNFISIDNNVFHFSSLEEAEKELERLDAEAALARLKALEQQTNTSSQIVLARDILLRELASIKTGHVNPRRSWMVLDGIRKAQKIRACSVCGDKGGSFDFRVDPKKIGWRCPNKHLRWC